MGLREQTWTIPNGQQQSATPIVRGHLDVVSILIPAAFTGTAVSFKGGPTAATATGPIRFAGTLLSYAVAAGCVLTLDPIVLGGAQYIHIVSNAAEGAERTVVPLFRDFTGVWAISKWANSAIAEFFTDTLAGRPLLFGRPNTEISRPMQAGFFGSATPGIVGIASTTTAPVMLGGTLTTAATMSLQFTANSTNRWTALPRKRHATTTASTATGARQAYTQYFRGAAEGFGGFFFAARFGVGDNKLSDMFVGMCALTTALAGAPSALLNMIGVGYDAADAAAGNWFLMHNDGAGAATKIDLGATNAARAANIGFDLYIYNPPGSGVFYVQLVNYSTKAVVYNGSVSGDVPAVDTGLCWKAEVRNDAVATQCSIEYNYIYVEALV